MCLELRKSDEYLIAEGSCALVQRNREIKIQHVLSDRDLKSTELLPLSSPILELNGDRL